MIYESDLGFYCIINMVTSAVIIVFRPIYPKKMLIYVRFLIPQGWLHRILYGTTAHEDGIVVIFSSLLFSSLI